MSELDRMDADVWRRRCEELETENERLREQLDGFREGLTKALNAAGVPAMPSWQAAIDYLVRECHCGLFLCPSCEAEGTGS